MKIQVSRFLRPIAILTLASQLTNASPFTLNKGGSDKRQEILPDILNAKYAVSDIDTSGSHALRHMAAVSNGVKQIVAMDSMGRQNIQQVVLGHDENHDKDDKNNKNTKNDKNNKNVKDDEDSEDDEDDEDDEEDYDDDDGDDDGYDDKNENETGDDNGDENDQDETDKDDTGFEKEEEPEQIDIRLPSEGSLSVSEQHRHSHIKQKRDKTPALVVTDSETGKGDNDGQDDHKDTDSDDSRSDSSCIDSFVNYALQFRERCTVQCLREMAHIFSNPNVLGMLSCYGCSSFLVQGTYVLGADCAPVFSTPSPSQKINADGKSGNDTVTAIPTNAKLGDLQKDVHPADAQLFPLNFGDMMKGLRNIDMKELQDWFDIGQGLVNVVQTNNIAASAKNSTMTSRVKLEMEEERQKADKGLFNMFVSKAAGFANWILTPEMVEGTGAFDRLNNSKIL